MTITIQVTKPPVFAGEVAITKFVVTPVKYVGFCAIVAKAKATEGDNFERLLLRARLLDQVVAHSSGKKTFPLDDEFLLRLPAAYANNLRNALSGEDSPVGKILSKGDSFTTPIVYKLGTPIITQTSETITELEFIAKTYGDIEDVIVETSPLQQSIILLERCATPVATENITSLMSMPSWAVDQITMEDGLNIVNDVLPVFLGEQAE